MPGVAVEGFDGSVCWICGGAAERKYAGDTASLCCSDCGVEWERPPAPPKSYRIEAAWYDHQEMSLLHNRKMYHIDEYVDFAEEGAPSCPA